MGPGARQLLVELRGCPPSVIANTESLRGAAETAMECLAAPIVFGHAATSGAGSLTGIAIGEEAYVIIRAWPSEGVVSADIVAPTSADASPCVKHLCAVLHPSSHIALELARGMALSSDSDHPAG